MASILAFVTTGFWMWMIVDCLRNDPQKNTWIWILIFLYFPGAVIYFLLRRAPYLNLPMPQQVKRWSHRDKLWNAEAAARNIGKAYQYVNLGNVLCDIGQFDKAADAYQQALDKEPQNPQALWGMAFAEVQRTNFKAAKYYLEQLLKIDPNYKNGEASLAYGQTLFELQDWQAAQDHLEKDVKYWGHPEAAILLATLHMNQGNPNAARQTLDSMLFRVKGAPQFHYRRKQHLVRKAERMLRGLAKS